MCVKLNISYLLNNVIDAANQGCQSESKSQQSVGF